MSKSASQAANFVAEAQKRGFAIGRATDSCVSLIARFEPGNTEAFGKAAMAAHAVLGMAPLRGGSVWGDDGIAASIAVRDGVFELKKTGEAKLFMKALAKII